MEDQEILDLFFDRNERAITETAAKYGRRLSAISHAITGTDADTEECVSDTYLSAWNHIPPERPVYYGAWLSRIVRNLSLDCLAKQTALKRAGTVPLDETLEDFVIGTPDIDVDEIALGDFLDAFLRRLSSDDRLLFLRRYFYGDSLEEISCLTKIRANTIAVRLSRLKRRLTEELKKEGFFHA